MQVHYTRGQIGPEIEDLQRTLRAKGFDPGRISGQYDEPTCRVVAHFQALMGLYIQGGIFLQRDWDALTSYEPGQLDRTVKKGTAP